MNYSYWIYGLLMVTVIATGGSRMGETAKMLTVSGACLATVVLFPNSVWALIGLIGCCALALWFEGEWWDGEI